MPRVIAGKAGGIKLYTNQEKLMRPTADRMKEAVFSSLQSGIDSKTWQSFLDLFAGCGQMGIEALSRGMHDVVLVEQNWAAQKTIRRNLEKTKLNAEIIPLSANRAIKRLITEQRTFDLIYFDPPWQQLNAIWQKEEEKMQQLLNKNGKILIEHSRRISLNIERHWQIEKEKQYGLSGLTVLCKSIALE